MGFYLHNYFRYTYIFHNRECDLKKNTKISGIYAPAAVFVPMTSENSVVALSTFTGLVVSPK